MGSVPFAYELVLDHLIVRVLGLCSTMTVEFHSQCEVKSVGLHL
jgi:hypothetical protein